MEALRWNIDWQLTWSAVSLTRLAFFFFTSTRIFFCLDSNFKISNRVCSHDICLVFFRSWTYILQISTHVFYCIRCILQVSTYVLRFQHVFTIGIILSATERHTKLTHNVPLLTVGWYLEHCSHQACMLCSRHILARSTDSKLTGCCILSIRI